jgi:predicted RNA-binding protein YlxR (DUF448 family)
VAYIALDELTSIEGFDEELAGELQRRALAFIETRDAEFEKRRVELGVSDEVKAIEGLTAGMLVRLGDKGVKTLDDLADLAGDELREIVGEDEMDAGCAIIASGAHWFSDETPGDAAAPGARNRGARQVSVENALMPTAPGSVAPTDGPLRACLATGEARPADAMIRCRRPDGRVLIGAQLPGRGLWVTASAIARRAIARKAFPHTPEQSSSIGSARVSSGCCASAGSAFALRAGLAPVRRQRGSPARQRPGLSFAAEARASGSRAKLGPAARNGGFRRWALLGRVSVAMARPISASRRAHWRARGDGDWPVGRLAGRRRGGKCRAGRARTGERLNMTESTETKQTKPLTLGGAGRIDLKPKVEMGQVRQKFSHGRTKAVTVEVKKKRIVPPSAGHAVPSAPVARPAEVPPPPPPPAPIAPKAVARRRRRMRRL